MERDPRDQRIAELEAKVAWAMGVIERLEKRVVELEAQLAKNSTNSSKPPSSDGPGVQRPEVKPKGAKRGGQRGHLDRQGAVEGQILLLDGEHLERKGRV